MLSHHPRRQSSRYAHRALAGLAACGLVTASANALATWYVSPCGDDSWGGSGTDCASFAPLFRPKRTIQAAINAAIFLDDEIVVLPGIYNERIDFHGKKVRVRAQDPASGTTISGSGLSGSVVSFTSGEGPGSILEGFRIVNGSADFGAGVQIRDSSPTIRQCTMKDNSAPGAGGGMLVLNGSPLIDNCVFLSNYGGSAGGVYNENASPTFRGCRFEYNDTSNYGGGAHNAGTGISTFAGCLFQFNHASLHGGGVSNFGVAKIVNCVFRDNSALTGGAISCHMGATGTRIAHCTLAGNTTNASEGGALSVFESSISMTNCIAWDNSAPAISASGGQALVTYCNVHGGWPGAGNINANPMFAEPAEGDYALLSGSPCIDAGNTGATAELYLDVDFALQPRAVDNVQAPNTGIAFWSQFTDMGAFESPSGQSPVNCPADLTHDGSVSGMDLASLLAAWGRCN